MKDVRTIMLEAFKAAKKEKSYLTTKQINNIVNEVFDRYYSTPIPKDAQN